MKFQNNLDFAKGLDAADPLKGFRSKFYFPQHEGREVVYFTGNSLGLQPKNVAASIQQELDDWAKYGVEGHFHAKNPWYSYHEQFAKPVSEIVGALPSEVVIMNQLTSNLHFLLASFYRPSKKRYKIICEEKAFPSDQYALETQIKIHGLDPGKALIEIGPDKGEYIIRDEKIIEAIAKHKDELALVMIGGVNYFTGQVFDLASITKAAHEAGALAGFDLAHAAGNVELKLHEWQVDFACWCTYKYMNSGPGSVGGAFVHEKHHKPETPRLGGWWGHDKEVRFKMEKGFKPMPTAEAWQLSNAPVISMACHKAALEMFSEAGMQNLIDKSKALTGYLEYIISEVNNNIADPAKKLEIITPAQRGCQLSIVAHGRGRELFTGLQSAGVIADWREPCVIRCAPVPMYNSFEDIYRFGEILTRLVA